jgi:hypothetical protein
MIAKRRFHVVCVYVYIYPPRAGALCNNNNNNKNMHSQIDQILQAVKYRVGEILDLVVK